MDEKIYKVINKEKVVYAIDKKFAKNITVAGKIGDYIVGTLLIKSGLITKKLKDKWIKIAYNKVKNSMYLIEQMGVEFYKEYLEGQDITRREELPKIPEEDIYPIKYVTV